MDDTIIIQKHNNTYFKILCNEEQSYELYDFFECYSNNYMFDDKYKAGHWNGKISFYNKKESLLPIGLLYKLKEFLVRYNYKVKLDFDTKEFYNEINDDDMKEFYKIIFKNTDIFPRDYQHESIKIALKMKRGIIESATGSGKSLSIYSLIRFMMSTVKRKILLIVPNVSLTTQMFNDFSKDYGWIGAIDYVSVLHGKSKRYGPNKMILISTWQSIYKKDVSFFEQYDAVIVDECLHGDTLIQIDNNEFKKIKDIKIGDCVLSYNNQTGNIEKDEVLKLHKNLINSNSENMYEVEFENGTVIKITGNHKILTKNRGYVRVDELTVDDDILENYHKIDFEKFDNNVKNKMRALYENQKN